MIKARRSAGGFTIIEVTIALALMMGGLVVAMTAINNRLRQENFYKGVGRFASNMNDVMNDVSTNNWPHVEGWECEFGGNLTPPGFPLDDLVFQENPSHQTGEGSCLYIGKAIQFGDSRTVVEDNGQYIIHTIMTHKNALIPIYDFDNEIAPRTPGSGSKPLTTLETNTPPGFSARDSKFFPNGIQVNQVYYLDDPSDPNDRVYLYGLAVVQVSGHGLKYNDLLLQSGAGHVGLRVVHDPVSATAKSASQNRPSSDAFANSLKRHPKNRNTAGNEISHNFNLPIYICLGDGRGGQALGILGGQTGGLLIQTEFDTSEIQIRC